MLGRKTNRAIAFVLSVFIAVPLIMAACTPKVQTAVVDFEPNGGDPIASVVFNIGDDLDVPDAENKDGFIFAGWFVDEALTTPAPAKVTQNLKLYAKWTAVLAKFTVTFDRNSTSAELTKGSATLQKEDGSTLTYAEFPEYSNPGYKFLGWHEGNTVSGDPLTSTYSKVIKGAVTYIASWEQILVDVTFNYNDGRENETNVVQVRQYTSVTEPQAPVHKDNSVLESGRDEAVYEFVGWSTKKVAAGESASADIFNFSSKVESKDGLTLYAVWATPTFYNYIIIKDWDGFEVFVRAITYTDRAELAEGISTEVVYSTKSEDGDEDVLTEEIPMLNVPECLGISLGDAAPAKTVLSEIDDESDREIVYNIRYIDEVVPVLADAQKLDYNLNADTDTYRVRLSSATVLKRAIVYNNNTTHYDTAWTDGEPLSDNFYFPISFGGKLVSGISSASPSDSSMVFEGINGAFAGISKFNNFSFQNGTQTVTASFPSTYTFIGAYAFAGAYIDGAIIAPNITTVGTGAFMYTKNITKIQITNAQTVGDAAFVASLKLESVVAGSSTVFNTSSLASLFGDDRATCPVLVEFNVGTNNPNYYYDVFSTSVLDPETQTGYFDFSINGGIYSSPQRTKLLYVPSGKVSFEIPDSVKTIDVGAFYMSARLERVYSTEDSQLTTIQPAAFYGIHNIGDEVLIDLSESNKITSITGGSVSSLSVPTFGVFYLSTVNAIFNDSLTSVQFGAFSICNGSITANGVVTVGDYAFSGGSIDNVKYSLGYVSLLDPSLNNESLTTVGNYAFQYLMSGLSSKLDTEIALPVNVTSYGTDTFYGGGARTVYSRAAELHITYQMFASSLVTVFVFDTVDSVKSKVLSIGERAFDDATNLIAIDISTVTDEDGGIGARAFAYCSSLASITWPAAVKAIPSQAFMKCDTLINIIIPEGVEEIGDSAFSLTTALSIVILPSTLTKIGTGAFSGSGIMSITIPDGVKSLTSTFSNCRRLSYINLGKVEEIGASVFLGCASLKTLTLPDTLKAVTGWANFMENGVSYIVVPESVETLVPTFDELEAVVLLNAPAAPNCSMSDFLQMFGLNPNMTLYVTAEHYEAYVNDQYYGHATIASHIHKFTDFNALIARLNAGVYGANVDADVSAVIIDINSFLVSLGSNSINAPGYGNPYGESTLKTAFDFIVRIDGMTEAKRNQIITYTKFKEFADKLNYNVNGVITLSDLNYYYAQNVLAGAEGTIPQWMHDILLNPEVGAIIRTTENLLITLGEGNLGSGGGAPHTTLLGQALDIIYRTNKLTSPYVETVEYGLVVNSDEYKALVAKFQAFATIEFQIEQIYSFYEIVGKNKYQDDYATLPNWFEVHVFGEVGAVLNRINMFNNANPTLEAYGYNANAGSSYGEALILIKTNYDLLNDDTLWADVRKSNEMKLLAANMADAMLSNVFAINNLAGSVFGRTQGVAAMPTYINEEIYFAYMAAVANTYKETGLIDNGIQQWTDYMSGYSLGKAAVAIAYLSLLNEPARARVLATDEYALFLALLQGYTANMSGNYLPMYYTAFIGDLGIANAFASLTWLDTSNANLTTIIMGVYPDVTGLMMFNMMNPFILDAGASQDDAVIKATTLYQAMEQLVRIEKLEDELDIIAARGTVYYRTLVSRIQTYYWNNSMSAQAMISSYYSKVTGAGEALPAWFTLDMAVSQEFSTMFGFTGLSMFNMMNSFTGLLDNGPQDDADEVIKYSLGQAVNYILNISVLPANEITLARSLESYKTLIFMLKVYNTKLIANRMAEYYNVLQPTVEGAGYGFPAWFIADMAVSEELSTLFSMTGYPYFTMVNMTVNATTVFPVTDEAMRASTLGQALQLIVDTLSLSEYEASIVRSTPEYKKLINMLKAYNATPLSQLDNYFLTIKGDLAKGWFETDMVVSAAFDDIFRGTLDASNQRDMTTSLAYFAMISSATISAVTLTNTEIRTTAEGALETSLEQGLMFIAKISALTEAERSIAFLSADYVKLVGAIKTYQGAAENKSVLSNYYGMIAATVTNASQTVPTWFTAAIA